MRSVCVFCGSSRGASPAYAEAALGVAEALVGAGIGIVYGGGDRGLMGLVADRAMALGGSVTGVLPRGLFEVEPPKSGLTSLIEVGSMHERKARMYGLADGFVGLPGGLGTLEELAEVATWAQLGLHAKPIVVVEVEGFWGPLLTWLDGAVEAGFVKPANRGIVVSVDGAGEVVAALRSYGWSGARPAITVAET
ncbi:MAG TPA: TIGR00730 family Rossman fold protein [Acidimicrobiales bacterium]